MKRARTLAPSGMRLRSAVCAPPSYLEEMHSNLSCRHPAHGQAPGNHTLRGKGSSMPLGHGVFRQVIIDPVLLPAAPNPRLFALLTTAFDVQVQTGYVRIVPPSLAPYFFAIAGAALRLEIAGSGEVGAGGRSGSHREDRQRTDLVAERGGCSQTKSTRISSSTHLRCLQNLHTRLSRGTLCGTRHRATLASGCSDAMKRASAARRGARSTSRYSCQATTIARSDRCASVLNRDCKSGRREDTIVLSHRYCTRELARSLQALARLTATAPSCQFMYTGTGRLARACCRSLHQEPAPCIRASATASSRARRGRAGPSSTRYIA